MPIVRTFAPFVAGLGTMSYGRFMSYNVIGGVAWVVICTVAGYLFGNLPFVKENFSLVVLAIIVLSLLPGSLGALEGADGAQADRGAAGGQAAGAGYKLE